MKKRILALTLACFCLIAVLAGCGSGETSDPGGETGTSPTAGAPPVAGGGGDIKGYFASSPETVDPQLNSSVDGATYIVHLFQGLYRFDWTDGSVELGDAESVDISADGLTWTFTLRSDIKWSDGEPVTAYDYEYSWKRLVDPASGAPYAEDCGLFILNGEEVTLGDVPVDELGVKALDERTFEVKLSGPCAFFEQVAVFPTFYPVRKDIVEANGDGWWTNAATFVSNGPFKAESFQMDDKLVVVPNDNYYDVGRVVPTSISFVFLADEDIAYTAFRSGEIDIGAPAPASEIPSLERDGAFHLIAELGTYYLSYNTEVAPYDNPLVRKALSLAIDREYLADSVFESTMLVATSIVGEGFIDENGNDFRTAGGDYISRDYEANKIAAQEALAEAGFPGGEGFPVIEYMYNTSARHEAAAEAIARDWEDVLGIRTVLVNQEWGVFLETRRVGGFEVARNGWISDWNDPSSMLTIFRSGGGNNDGNYSNPLFDQYFNESASSSDQAVRMRALHNAEKVLMEDWGCAPLMYYIQSFMASPDLQGWSAVPLGYTLLHLAHK
ncbi:MAG: peptide ABC transporter substrate-binding protein [Oscillospiraceae bacterium]|nr:peptide ABC transporter substrate-binding protein [Oscillospiraceae bacterium]